MTVEPARVAAPPGRLAAGPWIWIPLLLLAPPLLLLLPAEHAPWVENLWLRLGILLLVGWAVPGALLARLWGVAALGAPAYVPAAWGLGVCWLLGGALLAHYIPGPLAGWQLWTIYSGGGVVLVAASLTKGGEVSASLAEIAPGMSPRTLAGGGVLLLLIAVLLRLPGLGYHEFHTDEVVLVRQAALSIAGEWTALAEHTKGPGEIAIVLAVYRALNAIDEATVRLPFGLMSVGSALATAWLGLRMFMGRMPAGTAPWIGGWAALLLLSNGFALGLSRIAQYQAGILLLSALAVWAMWEFAQSGRPRWLGLAGVFSAFGMVLHYEFGVLALALLVLLGVGVRRAQQTDGRRLGHLWRTAGLTAGLGAALLAVAYVPPFFNPYFSTTQSYLSNRLGDTLNFNWPFFVEMGTFYNSTWFFFGLMGLAGLGTGLGLRHTAAHRSVARLPVLVLTVWWLPFFVIYIFVVQYPGTHFYQMMTAWALLAALPLAWLSRALWRQFGRGEQVRRDGRWLRRAALGLAGVGVAAWLAISVFYLHVLFFRQNPEYLVNHPRHYLELYWAPYPVPQKPRFGFPIHAGWKAIGVLGEWGYLQGTYTSNDRSWGLRNWYRDHLVWIEDMFAGESPDYVLSAVHIQEENLAYHDGYHDTHVRIGEVRFRGESRIELWAREPLPVPYVTFDAEDFDLPFRDEYARLPAHRPAIGRQAIAIDQGNLGETMTLAQAELPRNDWMRGSAVHLAFTWLPQTALDRDYKLFVHVADGEGRPLAQWDGFPGLNTSRTSTWPVDVPFVDHVLLPLPDSMPPGEYTLLVGLYDPADGARLGDRAVTVAPVRVE